jgi:4-diphosphocytidyl-2C-methyl-D-erythritol kinase
LSKGTAMYSTTQGSSTPWLTYHVDTNEKKANLYSAGLTIHLQEQLVHLSSLSYNELASAAIDQERMMKAAAEADEKKRKMMMPGSAGSGSSSGAPTPPPQQAAIRPPQQFSTSNFPCFNCEKMGHFTRECRLPKQSSSP